MRELLNRLGGPHGISLAAWLILAPISILFTAEVLPEGGLPGRSYAMGLLVGFIGHGVTGMVLLIGKKLFLKDVAIRPRPYTTLGIMAVAGILRGLSVAVSLEAFGIVAQADYFERMRSGLVLIVVWFGVAGLVINSRSSYRQSYASLFDAVHAQLELRTRGEKLIAESRAEIMVQIRQTLQDALRIGSRSADIHVAVDEMVRPLAHRLEEDTLSLQSTPTNPKRRIRFTPVVMSAFNRTGFHPGPTAAMAIFGTVLSRLWTAGPIAIAEAIVNFGLIWALLEGARRMKVRGILTPLVWIATGLAAASATDLITNATPFSNPLAVAYLSVNVFFPAALFAFLEAYELEAKRNLNLLRQNLTILEWETKALKQRLWVERKRLGRFVHSELQSRLRAFALRFDFQGADPSPADIERLRVECEAAMVFDDEGQSFEEFIEDQRQLWEGVMEVELESSDWIIDQLNQDHYAATSVAEVVREGLANAVKHGKATRARVILRYEVLNDQLGLLKIEVRNNGYAPGPGAKGIGSKAIAEVVSEFVLRREEAETVLHAVLPVKRDLELVS